MIPSRVLVVEDEAIIAAEIESALSRFGYNVLKPAYTGEDAIRIASQERPDAAILDICLPGKLDGIDVARKLQIPFVVLTALNDDETLQRALDARAGAFLTKPCSPKQLHAALQTALSQGPQFADLPNSAAILEQFPAGVVIASVDKSKLLHNRKALDLLGGQLDPIFEVMDKALQGVASEGVSINTPSRVLAVDAAPVYSAQGEIEASVAAIADVSGIARSAHRTAHDMLQALRSIHIFAELVQSEPSIPACTRRHVSYIVRASNRLIALVNGLVEEISTGGRAMEPLNANELASAAVELLQATLTENDAVVHIFSLPQVRGNRVQLIRVFQNLIDNAVRYRSGEQPRILVSAEQSGSDWIFEVRDNGIGIAPEDRQRVFQDREQISPTTGKGAGIGLAVCRSMIEQHGGTIWVEPAEGGGSAFRFTLPSGEASASA